jgi:hypothetical protein
MRAILRLVVALLGMMVVAGSSAARASEEHHSAEFERLKSLAGVWEGQSSDAKESKDVVRIEYSVTAGGNAVIEKLAVGSPYEMVSVYYDDHGKLQMTHYCAAGNRPELELTHSSSDRLEFSLSPRSTVDLNSMHIHELVVAFNDADHITETWTGWLDGKKQKGSVFVLSRKK